MKKKFVNNVIQFTPVDGRIALLRLKTAGAEQGDNMHITKAGEVI